MFCVLGFVFCVLFCVLCSEFYVLCEGAGNVFCVPEPLNFCIAESVNVSVALPQLEVPQQRKLQASFQDEKYVG